MSSDTAALSAMLELPPWRSCEDECHEKGKNRRCWRVVRGYQARANGRVELLILKAGVEHEHRWSELWVCC